MSVNAISSVSLYEYYYTINSKNNKEEISSPLAEEMKKYGLTPTDSEALNIAMLRKAKTDATAQNQNTEQTIPNYERPWADIMYQLDLDFNADPKDDITDIKEELAKLVSGISDDELESEVKGLENYVEQLYLSFEQINLGGFDNSTTLSAELNNLSMLNQIRLQ